MTGQRLFGFRRLVVASAIAALAAPVSAVAMTDVAGSVTAPKASAFQSDVLQSRLVQPKASAFQSDMLQSRGIGSPVAVRSDDSGFGWTDTGIGIGAGGVVLLLLIGGSTVLIRRHKPVTA
jgi:hypothetical protein